MLDMEMIINNMVSPGFDAANFTEFTRVIAIRRADDGSLHRWGKFPRRRFEVYHIQNTTPELVRRWNTI